VGPITIEIILSKTTRELRIGVEKPIKYVMKMPGAPWTAHESESGGNVGVGDNNLRAIRLKLASKGQ
jgi:hypothetical protein